MEGFILKRPMFGKDVEIVLQDVEESLGMDIGIQAYEEGLRLQSIFNLYDKNSEISLLNRKRELTVSPELAFVLVKAKELAVLSGHAYDVSHGRRFLARKQGEAEPIVHCTSNNIIVKGRRVVLDHDDVVVDLGSIAKGYIVDRIAEILIAEGVENGLVNGRGDIRVFGTSQQIDIQHPRKDACISTINLVNAGVATSGDYMQYHGSHSNSHIVGQTDAVSVTVVAKSAMIADAMATVLSVITPANREVILGKFPGIRAFIVDTKLRSTCFNSFDKLVMSP